MARQQGNRKWTIKRDEFIDHQGYASEPAFRAAVEAELAAWENSGHRLGRGLIAAPIREQVVEGRWETTGWLFEDFFVPAPKSDRQPVKTEPDALPDLDEVVAEAEQPAEEPQAA